ncbi:choice-of-anchor G family protein [Agromyces atrinae]|uniref:Choice-of-anchor G family protein n=1 Tax=Agromyces atrinae TaxID=592376 RepID=A0A4V1R266_9MICO|nr:choice-of-anchor G family protein [Agromyces atrinae]NYD68729.1 hypothetical protein [Agromyces atrinae]RXZ86086.1 choice-of-anchor G family protein [Agromyces atrinae]
MSRTRSLTGILSAAVAALVLVPGTVATTTASWPDEEWAHGAVETSSFRCGVDEGYASSSTGRFLSGELLGQDLDSLLALRGVDLAVSPAGAVAVDPPTSINQGSAPPAATFTNPLTVSALSGIVGLDLTGLTVGLPLGSAGAVNQYTQVATTGTAAAASGLVSNSGGIGVTPTTPQTQLPQPATVALSTFLPSAAGITDARLRVGAVASSATLDGCAALRSALWGDGSVSGVVRSYGIAGLGLEIDSPLLGGLVTSVNSGLPTIQTAVNSLLGTNGLISSTIRSSVLASLVSGLGVGSMTGTVSLSGLDLAGSVSTLLATPLTDGVVSIDLSGGRIAVDLDALLGYTSTSLNTLPPNTELVLNDAVVNALVARIGALLDTWTTNIISALTEEIRTAVVTVDLRTTVSLLTGAVQLVRLDIDLVAPLSGLLDQTATFTIGTEVLGLVSVLNGLLAPLGINVNTLLSTLGGLATGLVVPVANIVTTTAIAAVTSLGSTLAAATAPIVSALSLVVGALPEVLSLLANVQSSTPAVGDATPGFTVSALRIGLAPVIPGDVASLTFATSTVGPISPP